MDWGDAEWWWEVALDGIGGAVLAVVGVAATLWYDRKRRRDDQRDRALTDLRVAADEMSARARELFESDRQDDRVWNSASNNWFLALTGAEARAHGLDPLLEQELSALREWVLAIDDLSERREDVSKAAAQMAGRVYAWMKGPEVLAARKTPFWVTEAQEKSSEPESPVEATELPPSTETSDDPEESRP